MAGLPRAGARAAIQPCYRSSRWFRKPRSSHRRADARARRWTSLGKSEGRQVRVARPVGGRKHLVLVFEAQSESEQDLPLGIHAAVHALFDTVDRPERDLCFSRKLGLGHQAIFTKLSNAILSNRVRFINFHSALLARHLSSESFSESSQLLVVSTEHRISLVGIRFWSSWPVGDSRLEKLCYRREMRDPGA